MKVAIAAILLCVATLCAGQCDYTPTTAFGTHAPQGPYCKGQVLLEEHFNSFDMNLWQHQVTFGGGGNGEFNMYHNDRRNSFVQDGKLVIRPTLTTDVVPDLYNCHLQLYPCSDWRRDCDHYCSWDNIAPPVQSALIRTVDSFNFKYGNVEIRAKLPGGDWLWPALWLMPRYSVYGGWPRSGEIDLCEMKGNRNLYNGNGQNIGNEEFGNTLHFGNEYSASWSSWFSRRSPQGQGWSEDFHLYQMEWAEWGFSFSVDNNWIGTIPVGTGFYDRGQLNGWNPWDGEHIMAPFNQEFYLIFNVAVGGTNGYFPNDGNASGKPWSNQSPTARRDFWEGRSQWLDSWRLGSLDSSLQIDHVIIRAY